MFSLLPTMDGAFPGEEFMVDGVRSRKKHSEPPSCPVCSCTVRAGELDTHLAVELDRLNKLSCNGKRKISSGPGASSSRSQSSAGPSTEPGQMEEVDVTGCTGGDVYQRVKTNRMRRLRTRSRRSPSLSDNGECPVCGVRMQQSKLWRHAVRCLRRTGAPAADDEYIPDTSSDDEGSIDVENDASEASGGGFGAEYRWCGEWRVRATALAAHDSTDATPVRRASTDTQLVVDGDEDTELYGPPQYSPSRIAPETEHAAMDVAPSNGETTAGLDAITPREQTTDTYGPPPKKYNGMVEASTETRIAALKARIRDLESRPACATENKCLICLGPYTSPAVSIQCWHVYCEVCWLESLRAKKLCPQCNAITTTRHLRRIYM